MRFQAAPAPARAAAEQPFERHAAGAQLAQHQHAGRRVPSSIFLLSPGAA
jgi:hypothetical protein